VTRLVLATRNLGKVAELRRILAAAGLGVHREAGVDGVDGSIRVDGSIGDIEVVGLDAVPDVPDVVETGTTFAENALLKARTVARASGSPAVADDSGLCVDILGGAPGIFSARWAGRHGDDRANLELLLAQLADVPAAHRGAHFDCAAALALPDGAERVVEGRLTGRVRTEPLGVHGFGYDPIFVPTGLDLTTAQLSPAEKDAISHRGRAFRALLPELRLLLSHSSADARSDC
jgi:XTP/dITP diphosphohydrolase